MTENVLDPNGHVKRNLVVHTKNNVSYVSDFIPVSYAWQEYEDSIMYLEEIKSYNFRYAILYNNSILGIDANYFNTTKFIENFLIPKLFNITIYKYEYITISHLSYVIIIYDRCVKQVNISLA